MVRSGEKSTSVNYSVVFVVKNGIKQNISESECDNQMVYMKKQWWSDKSVYVENQMFKQHFVQSFIGDSENKYKYIT